MFDILEIILLDSSLTVLSIFIVVVCVCVVCMCGFIFHSDSDICKQFLFRIISWLFIMEFLIVKTCLYKMKLHYKEFADDQKELCRRFSFQHVIMKSLRIRNVLEPVSSVVCFYNEEITNV